MVVVVACVVTVVVDCDAVVVVVGGVNGKFAVAVRWVVEFGFKKPQMIFFFS